MSGGDTVTTRDLYEKNFDFTPTYTIWMRANKRPKMPDDDDAVWERLKEIPFRVRAAQLDKNVRLRFSDPAIGGPAVMRWLVEGAVAYLRDGLPPVPEAIARATADNRESQNPISEFLNDYTVPAPGSFLSIAGPYAAYLAWTRVANVNPKEVLGKKEVSRRVPERYERDSIKSVGRGFKGLALASADNVPQTNGENA